MNVSIKTDRLKIRDLTVTDAEAMFAYRGNADIALFQSFHPANVVDVEGFILKNTRAFDIEGEWFQLGILHEDVLIGDIGLHFFGPENKQVEIGYTLSRGSQGKGYAREAVRAVLDFLFSSMRKHRVMASVDPENLKSIALLNRLGFHKEGFFRESVFVDGRWKDDVVYALLEKDWMKEDGIASSAETESSDLVQGIRYREAFKDDVRGIIDLYRQLNAYQTEVPLVKALRIWDEIERKGASVYFIALDGERIVSTCNVNLIENLTWDGKPFAVIENVVTDEAYRRKGIGRKIIEMAVAYAQESGCYKVQLMSGSQRTEAHAFYVSLGFDGESKKGFQIRFP